MLVKYLYFIYFAMLFTIAKTEKQSKYSQKINEKSNMVLIKHGVLISLRKIILPIVATQLNLKDFMFQPHWETLLYYMIY